jgi:hypothetical protein
MTDMLVWYNPDTIQWRLSIGDTFETEKRYVRDTKETARKVAEIYSAIVQDDIVVLSALYNGTEVDANKLSPYNAAFQLAAELIVELGKDLAQQYQNDPQKRGYYDGYATFEILSLIIPATKAGPLGKLGKVEFLTELGTHPFFSPGGKGYAAMQRLQPLITKLGDTKMSPELYSLYSRYRQMPEAAGETAWQTFKRVLDANKGKGNIPARVWGQGLEEVRDEMFHLVAQNQLSLSDLPSYTKLYNATKGRGIGSGPDAMHIHHIVEGARYQSKLGIPEAQWDDVPGFIMNGIEHSGPDGLTHRLYEVIGESADSNVIIAGHRQVYRERGFNDLWEVTQKWFISKGYTIPPEP